MGISKEHYLNELKKIEDLADQKIKAIQREYALSNAEFKIHDILFDERRSLTIKVDRITTYVGGKYEEPIAVYHGFELKKDLTIKKSETRQSFYGYPTFKLSLIKEKK